MVPLKRCSAGLLNPHALVLLVIDASGQELRGYRTWAMRLQ